MQLFYELHEPRMFIQCNSKAEKFFLLYFYIFVWQKLKRFLHVRYE